MTEFSGDAFIAHLRLAGPLAAKRDLKASFIEPLIPKMEPLDLEMPWERLLRKQQNIAATAIIKAFPLPEGYLWSFCGRQYVAASSCTYNRCKRYFYRIIRVSAFIKLSTYSISERIWFRAAFSKPKWLSGGWYAYLTEVQNEWL